MLSHFDSVFSITTTSALIPAHVLTLNLCFDNDNKILRSLTIFTLSLNKAITGFYLYKTS